jgi:hypothetical protein
MFSPAINPSEYYWPNPPFLLYSMSRARLPIAAACFDVWWQLYDSQQDANQYIYTCGDTKQQLFELQEAHSEQ